MIEARRISFFAEFFTRCTVNSLKSHFHRLFLVYCFVIFPILQSIAGPDCSSSTVYNGYINGDIEEWKRGMAELREAYTKTADPCLLFSLTEAKYGYIGYLLGLNQKDEARPLIESFEADIDSLAGFPQYSAETESFRLALLGFHMALNPAKAMILGPRALKQLEKAVATGSASPSVWLEKANSEASMPSFAGGSKEKAAASFREALRLFEADPELSAFNWKYMYTMVLLGQTLEKLEDYQGAREVYLKALGRAPGFLRVRDELLPAVEKKLK